MYLSAELLAIANRTVQDTFEKTSVAWQAIPHWNTCDPGQTRVRADVAATPTTPPLTLDPTVSVPFKVSLAAAIAPTADPLLAQVIAKTVDLAKLVDDAVVAKLRGAATDVTLTGVLTADIINGLIDARAAVEDAGYRAPSCLITNTAGLKVLSGLDSGFPVTESVLSAVNANALHRVTTIEATAAKNAKIRIIELGRRQRIAYGGAADASPGEEPVDLAVAVLPSVEVVGEDGAGQIDLAVRIRFATRIKDAAGIVAVIET